ncbi:hypothetical protein GN956_G8077 [Arapaima gigas]
MSKVALIKSCKVSEKSLGKNKTDCICVCVYVASGRALASSHVQCVLARGEPGQPSRSSRRRCDGDGHKTVAVWRRRRRSLARCNRFQFAGPSSSPTLHYCLQWVVDLISASIMKTASLPVLCICMLSLRGTGFLYKFPAVAMQHVNVEQSAGHPGGAKAPQSNALTLCDLKEWEISGGCVFQGLKVKGEFLDSSCSALETEDRVEWHI